MNQKKFKPTEIGMIPDDWEVKSINEVAEVVGGGTPSTKNPEYWDGDIAWITPRDLSNFKFRYIDRGERNITKKGLENSSAKLVPVNTVLLTTRAPVGYVAIAKNEVSTNQGFRSLISKNDTTPEFLFYLLKRNVEILKSNSSGTTFGELSGSRLKALQFAFPDIPEQFIITKILSDLDSKIELNNQMNKTLEEIGRTIFQHWFVDFEFPNEEGKPYQSSGGKMEYNEKLGKAMPKGWKLGSLGDIAENPRRGIKPEVVDLGMPYIGLEHMPRQSIALSDWETVEKVASNKFQFYESEILFGKLRPYFHKVGVAAVNGVCSTDILVITPKSPEWYGFVLYHVSSEEFVNYTDAASTGTRMPRTNWEDMARYEIVTPTNNVAQTFNNKIFPLIQKICINILQLRILVNIRDSLLPKLMSGKIRVPVEVR